MSFPNAELPISDSHGLMVFKELLNFIDSFTVIMFSVEIVLKWIDNFRTFWRNPWNVFDLFVTVLVRAVFFLLPPSLYLLLSSLSPAALPLSLDYSFHEFPSFLCPALPSFHSFIVYIYIYLPVSLDPSFPQLLCMCSPLDSPSHEYESIVAYLDI